MNFAQKFFHRIDLQQGCNWSFIRIFGRVDHIRICKYASFVAQWLERSFVKHGRLGLKHGRLG